MAILKCNIDNPTNENCAKMITEHLDGKMSIKSEEIISVTDYRPKKGPLIVEVNSIEKKAALIRNSETTQNYVLKDCLTRVAIMLRRRAIKLKKIGLVNKVWTYRGDIYITASGEDRRLRATHRLLLSMEGSKTSVPEPEKQL